MVGARIARTHRLHQPRHGARQPAGCYAYWLLPNQTQLRPGALAFAPFPTRSHLEGTGAPLLFF